MNLNLFNTVSWPEIEEIKERWETFNAETSGFSVVDAWSGYK